MGLLKKLGFGKKEEKQINDRCQMLYIISEKPAGFNADNLRKLNEIVDYISQADPIKFGRVEFEFAAYPGGHGGFDIEHQHYYVSLRNKEGPDDALEETIKHIFNGHGLPKRVRNAYEIFDRVGQNHGVRTEHVLQGSAYGRALVKLEAK